MNMLKGLIAARLAAAGRGSIGVIDAALSGSSENAVQNKAIYTALGNKTDKETVTAVSGSTPTITPEPNTIYTCGELTNLTISNPPATGSYSIVFYSGATATVVTGIDNFTPEANKRYRIDVQDGYATFASWPYTPTP